MKQIVIITLACVGIIAASSMSNARSFSGPRDIIGLHPELVKKFYKYTCYKNLCGNYNVTF